MTPEDRVLGLPIWRGTPRAEPLAGGITNLNFRVTDAERSVFVRIGADIAVHHVLRFNELAAARAAHAAGVSPAVLYHEPGVLVTDWLDASTLTAADLRAPAILPRVLALLARAHREMPRHLRGPALSFWVFHILRDYAATLRESASRHAPHLPALMAEAAQLEAAVGPIDLVFAHNDLLPANLMDDGTRLWLIDWDYAGWGSPLFDLGGLAANAALAPAQEAAMLESYFDRAPDAALWRSYRAMKCAAALREALWSMVSEAHSPLAFDFAAYTETTLAAYAAALAEFAES